MNSVEIERRLSDGIAALNAKIAPGNPNGGFFRKPAKPVNPVLMPFVTKPRPVAHDTAPVIPKAPSPPTHGRDVMHVMARKKPVTVPEIIKAVCDETGISPREIKGNYRGRSTVMARHVVAWVAMTQTLESSVQIGVLMGRDHSTTLNSMDRVQSNMPMFLPLIRAVKNRLELPL